MKKILIIGFLSILFVSCSNEIPSIQQGEPAPKLMKPVDSFFTGNHDLASFNAVLDSTNYKQRYYIKLSDGHVEYMWKTNKGEYISSKLPDNYLRFVFVDTGETFSPYCTYKWETYGGGCKCSKFTEDRWDNFVTGCTFFIRPDQIIRK